MKKMHGLRTRDKSLLFQKKKAGTFVPALIGFGRVAESAPLNGNGNRGGPTGQNVRNVRDHEVGRSTDANGVLSAVEAACRDNLDERLASAAGRIYVNFERERR